MRNDACERFIQGEGAERCNIAKKKGVKQADRQTDRWTRSVDRRGRSYLLNFLVARRHGRENATEF